MKKFKSSARFSIAVFVIAAMMLCFTGCSKTAVTSESFKAIASEKGMTIVDAIDQFAGYDYIKEVTLAVSADNSYQIEFYVLSDASQAQSFFEGNKLKFEQSKGDSFVESSGSGKNYSSYTLTSNNKYKFIEQVDATVIYVDVSNENKNAVEEFIKDMKY